MSSSCQSPVDIPAGAPRHTSGITLDYHATPALIGPNPSAVQVDCVPGSGATIDGEHYELRQFHLHCPAEHTFAGTQAAGALHLVHQSNTGELAVMGVMLVPGQASAGLAPVVTALNSGRSEVSVELARLLPRQREWVAYTGSLTTPPFTEGVEWRVFTWPLEISPDQLRVFTAVHAGNNRALQPIDARMFR